ncbi:MAG: glycosyltransferase [Planctomycetes bacterium]|nr:glycosyltransferase [Planctomycetota bacterium]
MRRPPHVLHVFSTFVPAGPEVRTVRLVNELGGAYRHSILAMDGRDDARAGLAPTVDARVLAPLPRAGSLATVRALRALVEREDPDLVCSYNWGAFDAVLATRTLGRARWHLHHEDGFNADEAEHFVPRRVWARRLALPGVARVVVPSHNLARVAREDWRLRPERVALVPNGIDLAPFDAAPDGAALRAELGVPADALVVGFVGHLRPVKNPLRLVRALARAKRPLHLLVLGDGEERGRVEAAARELGLAERVHLVGFQRDTAPWYRAMDLFALSSDSEQMPVALVEALASALPVAATDVGDVARMVPAEGRRFVVPRDEARLAAALDELADDAALRARLGAAGRRVVEERYTFARMADAYRELYARARRP